MVRSPITKKQFTANIKQIKLLSRDVTDGTVRIRANNFLLDVKTPAQFNQVKFDVVINALKKKQPKTKTRKKATLKKKVTAKKSSPKKTEVKKKVVKMYPRDVESFIYENNIITVGDPILMALGKKETKRTIIRIEQLKRKLACIFFELPKSLNKKYSDFIYTVPEEVTGFVDLEKYNKKTVAKKTSPVRKAATSKTKKTVVKKTSPKKATTRKRSTRRK